MPIYEYRCPDCGHEFDKLQKMSDPPVSVCPSCAETNVKKLISMSAFVLKGGGWYKDHYGLKPSGGSSSDSAGTDSPATDAAGASASTASSDSGGSGGTDSGGSSGGSSGGTSGSSSSGSTGGAPSSGSGGASASSRA